MDSNVIDIREQRIVAATEVAEQKAIAAREFVDARAKDVAYGTKLSAKVAWSFVRGFCRSK